MSSLSKALMLALTCRHVLDLTCPVYTSTLLNTLGDIKPPFSAKAVVPRLVLLRNCPSNYLY